MTDKSFEFDSVGLAQVLANNTLKIPAHQRDYAWTKDEVGRLLTDLAAAKDKRLDYFLGTIVGIKGGKTDPLEVVDGQQRLTTTYLLLSAIRDYLMAPVDDTKKAQLDRFKEAAREIGTDDDEAKFNERLGKLVKQKPEEKKDK